MATLGEPDSYILSRFGPDGKRVVYARDDTASLAIKDLASGRTIPLGGAPEAVFDVNVWAG